MRSLDNIVSDNDQDTVTARENNLTPYIAKEDRNIEVESLPTLGYFVPTGWAFVRDVIVADAKDGLAYHEFVHTVQKGFGYGYGKQGPVGKITVREFKKV